jgi:hypothetical protein
MGADYEARPSLSSMAAPRTGDFAIQHEIHLIL